MMSPLKAALLASAIATLGAHTAQAQEVKPEIVESQLRLLDQRGTPTLQALIRTQAGDSLSTITGVGSIGFQPLIGSEGSFNGTLGEITYVDEPTYVRSVHNFDLDGGLVGDAGTSLTVSGARGEIVLFGALPGLASVFAGKSSRSLDRIEGTSLRVRAFRLSAGRFAGDVRLVVTGRNADLEAFALSDPRATVTYGDTPAVALFTDQVFRAESQFSFEDLEGRLLGSSVYVIDDLGNVIDSGSHTFPVGNSTVATAEFARSFVDSRGRVRFSAYASAPGDRDVELATTVTDSTGLTSYVEALSLPARFKMATYTVPLTAEEGDIEGQTYVIDLPADQNGTIANNLSLQVVAGASGSWANARDTAVGTCNGQVAYASINESRKNGWELTIAYMADTQAPGSQANLPGSIGFAGPYPADSGATLDAFASSALLTEVTSYWNVVGSTLLEDQVVDDVNISFGVTTALPAGESGAVPQTGAGVSTEDLDYVFAAPDADISSRNAKRAMRAFSNPRRFDSRVADTVLGSPVCQFVQPEF